jgi:hypothetical protein
MTPAACGTPYSITALGGAIAKVSDDATAFTGRTAPFDVSADISWSDPTLDDACATWVREAMAIVEGDLLLGRYVNELSDASPEMTRSTTATRSSSAFGPSSAPGTRRTSST